jgi:hypothetical protein
MIPASGVSAAVAVAAAGVAAAGVAAAAAGDEPDDVGFEPDVPILGAPFKPLIWVIISQKSQNGMAKCQAKMSGNAPTGQPGIPCRATGLDG